MRYWMASALIIFTTNVLRVPASSRFHPLDHHRHHHCHRNAAVHHPYVRLIESLTVGVHCAGDPLLAGCTTTTFLPPSPLRPRAQFESTITTALTTSTITTQCETTIKAHEAE